ncbi:Alpha/Beta hydrolase protein [Crassisporium funariophilum]|nr:Alpha/Beta hydrolase protein [Crassisporium funariophilum]
MSGLFKVLWYGQKLLVYPSGFHEQPQVGDSPSMWSLPYQDVELLTKDKVKLRCYLIQVPSNGQIALGTAIVFHGNAMNNGDALFVAQNFYEAGYNVFMLEYRGYGNSDGRPSENGLCMDAQAALDYVLADAKLSQTPIIIYGQSLGGAVAIHLTCKNPHLIRALIFENTFTSMPDLIKSLPIIGHLSFLCTQRWESAQKVARMPRGLPMLMLSGVADEVIPEEHMRRLWEIALARGGVDRKVGRGKDGAEEGVEGVALKDEFVRLDCGTHNDTCDQPGYWEAVWKFLDSVLAEPDSMAG